MEKKTTEHLIESRPEPSRVVWEALEGFARQSIQTWLQRLLEEEVEELLGRQRYERREGIDAPAGYRNGHGKRRRVTLSAGTLTVRRPRVRGLAERFESRILPLFKRRTGPSATCSRRSTCTGWPRGTSTWPCGGCWARGRRCRRARSPA